jgi:Zn-dependent protease with chaperone function
VDQTAQFGARYFDGRSSRPRAVTVVAEVDGLRIRGEDLDRRVALREVEVSEPLGAAPRLLRLREGAYLESSEHDAVAAALRVAGHRDGVVSRVQTRWTWALGALVATLATIAVGYLYGLPVVAEFAAKRVPVEVEAAIGQRAIKIVDAQMFAPSSLPPARQAELSAAFARIAPQDGRAYRLEFRASRIGPNAVALPGGIMVMTDELVKLAQSDDEVIAVLAHELGHIEQRHFMRRLISSAIVGAVITLLSSEASGLLTALPATLADLAYSRDMEREADAFAVALLKRNGLSPEPLATMLERLERAHGEKSSKSDKGGKDGKGGDDIKVPRYLLTHPHTEERIAAIRAAR